MPACFIASEPVPFVVSPWNHRSWAVKCAIGMTYAHPSTGLRTNEFPIVCRPASSPV